jgi:hypothetical protein
VLPRHATRITPPDIYIHIYRLRFDAIKKEEQPAPPTPTPRRPPTSALRAVAHTPARCDGGAQGQRAERGEKPLSWRNAITHVVCVCYL